MDYSRLKRPRLKVSWLVMAIVLGILAAVVIYQLQV